MRATTELHRRKLLQIAGAVRRPGMWIPSGGLEAFLRDWLSDLAFIDKRESLLEQEQHRLRSRGLCYPDNVATCVTNAFRLLLPDVRELSLEIAAVYAELAHRMGYLALDADERQQRVLLPQHTQPRPHAPLGADELSKIDYLWLNEAHTPEMLLAEFGTPALVLGSMNSELALCHQVVNVDGWLVFHLHAARSGANPILRWLRLPGQPLEACLVMTRAGKDLSRRGVAQPPFNIKKWLTGHPNPYDDAPGPRLVDEDMNES